MAPSTSSGATEGPGRWLPMVVLSLAAACAPSDAQVRIIDLRVEGTSRLRPEAVIATSGLKPGVAVTREDLDAAAQKLLNTGDFTAVTYDSRPQPGGGHVVTLRVSEERAATPVQLDIPGVEETQLWLALEKEGALAGRTMPDNERAAQYYQRAIEAALERTNRRMSIRMSSEVNLATGQTVAVFRPARADSVSEIRFEGNREIPSPVLVQAVSRLLVGSSYSERDTRRILDLNIKPLYEEKARLTAAFPSVKAVASGEGTVSVIATVNEGTLWTLGKAEIAGDDLPLDELRRVARFPEGRPANWKEVTAQIAAVEEVLKRDGYLAVSSYPDRRYREESGIVDVTVLVKKGMQFRFGALGLHGLSAPAERASMALWKIREGEPLNGPYIDDYLRLLFKGPASGARSVQQELKVRPDGSVMDVVITFK